MVMGLGAAAHADNQSDAAIAESKDQLENIALVEARYSEVDQEAEGSMRQNVGASLSLPTGLWIMGSALLAMVGYKRMRNNANSK